MSFHHTLHIVVLACWLFATPCGAQWHDFDAPSPKREVRAVWLTTYAGLDWPKTHATGAASAESQRRELCRTLDQLQAANVNTVLMQARVRATTIYPSAYEPYDVCLTGKAGQSPGYDVLQFAIDECHKRGMELHAWVVAMPVGRWNALGCTRLRKRHPGMVRRIGAEGYMNPESEKTADYIATLCREIVDNYDVDGIHLDYIRYPEQWPRPKSASTARDNVTRIVRRVHQAIKSSKPWVKLSCSPIGKYGDLARHSSQGWNARDRVYQDAQGWLAEGIMDAIYPMMYFRGEQFYPFLVDWREHSFGRMVCPGLGLYFLSPQERDWPLETITRQMSVLRGGGLGHAYFRSKFFTDDTKGVYRLAAHGIDRHPALVPPMTWQCATPPSAPLGLSVKRMANADVLRWDAAPREHEDSYIVYNVYASTIYPVDTANAANLIATRLRAETLTVPAKWQGGAVHYAVTAMNRYGLESEAARTQQPIEAKSQLPFMANDGRKMQLPPRDCANDATHFVVETMQGIIVATRRYDTMTIDISHLPEGIYVLRSLNRKGITHRIGHFSIKR